MLTYITKACKASLNYLWYLAFNLIILTFSKFDSEKIHFLRIRSFTFAWNTRWCFLWASWLCRPKHWYWYTLRRLWITIQRDGIAYISMIREKSTNCITCEWNICWILSWTTYSCLLHFYASCTNNITCYIWVELQRKKKHYHFIGGRIDFLLPLEYRLMLQ